MDDMSRKLPLVRPAKHDPDSGFHLCFYHQGGKFHQAHVFHLFLFWTPTSWPSLARDWPTQWQDSKPPDFLPKTSWMHWNQKLARVLAQLSTCVSTLLLSRLGLDHGRRRSTSTSGCCMTERFHWGLDHFHSVVNTRPASHGLLVNCDTLRWLPRRCLAPLSLRLPGFHSLFSLLCSQHYGVAWKEAAWPVPGPTLHWSLQGSRAGGAGLGGCVWSC